MAVSERAGLLPAGGVLLTRNNLLDCYNGVAVIIVALGVV